jgi:hemolysin III
MPSHRPDPHDVVRAVKPRLRGWLHAGAFPVALAAGVVLVALAANGHRAPSGCSSGSTTPTSS